MIKRLHIKSYFCWFVFYTRTYWQSKLPVSAKQCWIVCLLYFFSLENFLSIWKSVHCRWTAKFFHLVLFTTEQGGFFSKPYLLWHGTPLLNHLQGPVTITPVALCLAVELSFLLTWFYSNRDSCTRPAKDNALHRCGSCCDWFNIIISKK